MEDTKLPIEKTPKVDATPAVETTSEVKPKKKANGCLIVFLVFLSIFLLLIVGAYLGYRKISKDLKTQVDLNVKYTQEDVIDLDEIIKITPDNYMDVKDGVDVSFSSAQVTAMLNAQSNPMFSKSQIKFNPNNVEISTLVKLELGQGKPLELPLYVSANVDELTSIKRALDIEEIKVGHFRLPSWIQEKISGKVEDWLAVTILENLSSIEFKSIRFTEDHVDIENLLFGALK